MKLIFTLIVCLLAQLAVARSPASSAPELSLEFIENRGQWAPPVRYRAALPGGGQLFAEADGWRLALLEAGALAHPTAGQQAPTPTQDLRGHAFDLRFVNAAPTAQVVAAIVTPEHRNYLHGRDPAHWASNVRSYRELRYPELWPGVEARLYENGQQQLEYDFTVAPGADPAAIGLRHAGAPVSLDAAGNLLVATTVGTVRELAPQAWQPDAAGRRQLVPCRYQLGAAGTVRFVVGRYDHTRPLVIDPILVFATYTGSVVTNWGCTATYDAQGNLYSGGLSFSLGYPVSLGAFQTTFAGLIDMALIKYNVTQLGPAARAWATYLGGSKNEFPHSLVVSKGGELLVLGSTSSDDFPVTDGAVQHTFKGGPPAYPLAVAPSYFPSLDGSDLVVSRLSADGTALRGSTYLGGSGNDGLLPLETDANILQLAHNYGDQFRGDILVDEADNVYVASCTASHDFPVGQGFQSTYRGGTTDGVVCKLNGNLTTLLWSSYLGGSAADAAYSLQLEPASGDVYVAGGTLSTDLPATAGALNPAASGNVDGFVSRIAASGASLVRTTYLGTSAFDQAYFVQLGTDGGVYVLGQSLGAYPTTAGVYTNANGRQFIHKLDANLSHTQLATVIGSGRTMVDFSPTAFLVDYCDRVYVCGWGGGANQNDLTFTYLNANKGGSTLGLPVTANAARAKTDGADFYVAQLGPGMSRLQYGSFFGGDDGYNNIPSHWGDHVDGGTSRFDPRGVVYQAICTCGTYAPFAVPPGANYYSATSGTGGSDYCNNAAFALSFQADAGVLLPSWAPLACAEERQAPLTVRFTDAASNAATQWDFGDGSPLAAGADVQHTYASAGYYQPKASLSTQCGKLAAALPPIEVQNQIIPNIITPNGDGANETFQLPPNCAPHIELYSRWGQRVFEAAAYQNDWNATGQVAGLYYYLLTYPDGHRVKGWVEVVK